MIFFTMILEYWERRAAVL